MWKTTKRYLIVTSVALNVAFVAVWIAYAALPKADPQEAGKPRARQAVWCPLHRELGVTQEQWTQIEPRLRDFQGAVGELCQRVQGARSEVIDLIAAREPDLEAIRAKQDEILGTKRKIQDLVVRHMLAEKQVLTPDQQARLLEILREQMGCGSGPPMSGRGFGPGAAEVLREGRDDADAGGTP
jgi:Spy/CpxP family protein refolding chaperone